MLGLRMIENSCLFSWGGRGQRMICSSSAAQSNTEKNDGAYSKPNLLSPLWQIDVPRWNDVLYIAGCFGVSGLATENLLSNRSLRMRFSKLGR